MSGNSVVADTNILINLLNGDSRLIELLEDTSLYLSFVSEIELYCSKKLNTENIEIIDRLLSQSYIIDLNPVLKKDTIYFRTEYSLKLPDAFIAATARNLHLPLITADKDFNRLKELSIIYYEK